MAGARSEINASAAEKSSAKSALVRLYNQLNEPPPPSLRQSDITEELEHFLEHHAEGKMDAAQFANFSKILKARYDRKLVDAALDNFK